MRNDRDNHGLDAYSVGAHDIADVVVVLTCRCGAQISAAEHGVAMRLWEAHADDAEAHP